MVKLLENLSEIKKKFFMLLKLEIEYNLQKVKIVKDFGSLNIF